MKIAYGAASHVGLVRQQNEDSYVVGGGIFAVCDGMGGARAGEVASELACMSLLDLESAETGLEQLEARFQQANRVVWKRARDEAALAGMGTTMTVVVTGDDELIVGHVGDSRAYRWRDGRLEQMTEDHSLVAELVRLGQLTPAQARVHPQRSIITRALGTEIPVEPDFFVMDLVLGDRVLLCTDGLTGMVTGDELTGILAAGSDPQAMADALVEAALAHGGEDNVTVVVLIALPDEGGSEGVPGIGIDGEPTDDRPRLGPMERCTDVSPGRRARRGGIGRLRRTGRGGEAEPGEECAVDPALVGGGRRIRRPALLIGVAALVVVAAVIVALFVLNSTVYHVGPDEEGRVALFRGMPWTPLGLSLYEPVEVSSVSVDQLDEYLQDRVNARDLVSKAEGLLFLRGLVEASHPAVYPPGSTETTGNAPIGGSATTGTAPGAGPSSTEVTPGTGG